MIISTVRLCIAALIMFVLTILPLPEFISGLRPVWVLILVLYIQFFLPRYFHLSAIVLLGLCLDVLLSTIIGEHILALVLTTWFASGRSRLFNFYTPMQQTMLIALLCLIYQMVIFLVDSLLGYSTGLWIVMGSVLLSMLCWPWVRWCLSRTIRLSLQRPSNPIYK